MHCCGYRYKVFNKTTYFVKIQRMSIWQIEECRCGVLVIAKCSVTYLFVTVHTASFILAFNSSTSPTGVQRFGLYPISFILDSSSSILPTNVEKTDAAMMEKLSPKLPKLGFYPFSFILISISSKSPTGAEKTLK